MLNQVVSKSLTRPGLPSPPHALEGTSFGPVLEDPGRQWKSAAFSESKREGFHGRTLREKRYRYTEWTPLPGADGETLRELYDLEEDPLRIQQSCGKRDTQRYSATVPPPSRPGGGPMNTRSSACSTQPS